MPSDASETWTGCKDEGGAAECELASNRSAGCPSERGAAGGGSSMSCETRGAVEDASGAVSAEVATDASDVCKEGAAAAKKGKRKP